MKIEQTIIDNINASIDAFKKRISEGEEKLKNIEEEYQKLMKKAKADTEADIKECKSELTFWEGVAARYSKSVPEDEKVVDKDEKSEEPECPITPEEAVEAPADENSDLFSQVEEEIPSSEISEETTVADVPEDTKNDNDNLDWPSDDDWATEPEEWK